MPYELTLLSFEHVWISHDLFIITYRKMNNVIA